MNNFYFTFYTEANLVCLIIFGIILVHDLRGVDRQEKRVRYDHALVAFMLYFVSDALWAAVIAGVLPKNLFFVITINFSNYLLMAAIAYTWFRYVLSVEQIPWRNDKRKILLAALPLILATAVLVGTYLAAPALFLNETLDLQPLYTVFLIAVPILYIIVIMLFTLREAARTDDPEERRVHLYVGLFPLTVIIGGLLQVVVLDGAPVFCFCCAIMMILFYIRAMEYRISLDPLTGLNNRGQLMHYVSSHHEKSCVIMLDVNDFKKINDTYGHAEGDRALVVIAEALKRTCASGFIGRYGGDEFVVIVHDKTDVAALTAAIRSEIAARCKDLPYTISVSVGHDEMRDRDFQKCMERADRALYADKARMKNSAQIQPYKRTYPGQHITDREDRP